MIGTPAGAAHPDRDGRQHRQRQGQADRLDRLRRCQVQGQARAGRAQLLPRQRRLLGTDASAVRRRLAAAGRRQQPQVVLQRHAGHSELIVTGMVAPSVFIGNMFVHLARDQSLQRQLREHPADIPAAVEEFLRLYNLYRGMARTARHDTVVGGQQIPEWGTNSVPLELIAIQWLTSRPAPRTAPCRPRSAARRPGLVFVDTSTRISQSSRSNASWKALVRSRSCAASSMPMGRTNASRATVVMESTLTTES